MIMMSFLAIGVVTIIWLVFGFSLAFGSDTGAGLLGGLDYLGLKNTLNATVGPAGAKIPLLAFAMFQLTFAIITAALLSGAVADRVRTRTWLVFIGVWTTLVYLPIAHWAFAFQDGAGGWIGDRLGNFGLRGGTAVEINSGFSALALAVVVGQRIGWRKDPMRPQSAAGAAGAGIPVVRLVRIQRGIGPGGKRPRSDRDDQYPDRHRNRSPELGHHRALSGWKANHARHRFRAVAGAVAITPRLRIRRPDGGARHRTARGRDLFAGDRPEVPSRLRRLPGRRRCSWRRWPGRHVTIGLFATTTANAAGKDGLFSGGGLDCWEHRPWHRSPRWLRLRGYLADRQGVG